MAHSRHNNPAGWEANISRSMKASAKQRECPACNRKGAMLPMVVIVDAQIGIKECRFCGHIVRIEKGGEAHGE